MKINRTVQTKKNVVSAVINRGVILLMGFLVRTALIRVLGSEYIGLSGLVTSILNILNLAELGFSSAVVYNMYKPIADDDTETICALLRFYRKAYNIIGVSILTVGLCLMPFLGHLIEGDIPCDVNIHLVYLVYLVNTCVGYFLFGYVSVLLTSHHRTDIDSYISSATFMAEYGIQILAVWILRSYYAYIIVTPLVTIAMNLVRYHLVRRIYPQYRCRGSVPDTVRSSVYENIKGLLVQKICTATRNTFDSVFISAYVGLALTGTYSNYFYVLSTVHGVLVTLKTSMQAGIGNSIASETQQKNHADMEMFNFIYMWVAAFCTACMLCLYQPFMRIWAGEGMMLPFTDVILFCLYFYLEAVGDIRFSYSSAAGLWWKDRFRSMMEMTANLVLNAVLGKLFGVTGIIAATIITIFSINFIYGSTIIYRNYFTGFSVRKYYRQHMIYMASAAAGSALCFLACSLSPLTGWAHMALCVLVCAIVMNLMYFAMYRRTRIFRRSFDFVMHRVLR